MVGWLQLQTTNIAIAVYIRKNIQLCSMACGTLLNDMQLNDLLFALIILVICPNSVSQWVRCMARLIPASNVVMSDTCIKTQKSEFRHEIFLPFSSYFCAFGVAERACWYKMFIIYHVWCPAAHTHLWFDIKCRHKLQKNTALNLLYTFVAKLLLPNYNPWHMSGYSGIDI